MRISKTYRPELLGGEAYLDVPAHRLVATNGLAVVVLPVSVTRRERSRFVPGVAMRSARASGMAEEQAKLIPGRSDKRRPALDWRGLTPRLRRGQRGTVTLTVSVSQLRKLADAMGVVSVTLTVPVGAPRGAIVVQPVDPEAEEVGVLLPQRKEHRTRPGRRYTGSKIVHAGFRRLSASLIKKGTSGEKGNGIIQGLLLGNTKRRNIEAQADAILTEAGFPELTVGELK